MKNIFILALLAVGAVLAFRHFWPSSQEVLTENILSGDSSVDQHLTTGGPDTFPMPNSPAPTPLTKIVGQFIPTLRIFPTRWQQQATTGLAIPARFAKVIAS